MAVAEKVEEPGHFPRHDDLRRVDRAGKPPREKIGKKPDEEEENKEEQKLLPKGRSSRPLLFFDFWLLSLAQ
jgi:hypothetical protein